jgi:hypothetical protein
MRAILFILIAILAVSSVSAVPENWEITFNNNLLSYSSQFIAGTKESASDGYDSTNDILQPPAPPSGGYILMRTVVEKNPLVYDYRSPLDKYLSKTWNMTLIAYDPVYIGYSGINTLEWNFLQYKNIKLTLIDYGTDSSRKSIISQIDTSESNSYSTNVTNAIGIYRYLSLKAEYIEYFNITLAQGWNLISFPLIFENETTNLALKDLNYSLIYGYDSKWFVPDSIDNFRGYWVYMNESSIFTMKGRLTNALPAFPYGWSLMGFPITEEMNLSLSNMTVLSYKNHNWISHVSPHRNKSIFTARPGIGYWINLNN